VAFKERLAAAEGFLFVSPEYNHSIPGTFKNVIDWASRGDLDAFAGKTAAVMASSPGGVGGMRMLPHLRDVLISLDLTVLPGQVTVSKANTAFDEHDKLNVPFYAKQVDDLCAALVLDVKRKRITP
jgi:NAD(P)H-dependent FMN reductase